MKQRDVRQQNDVSVDMIRRSARYWREHPWPQALKDCALARGIDWSTAIVLKLGIDEPGMPGLFGMLLTVEARFISFEIETNEHHTSVETMLKWEDVTSAQNISIRNPGFGAGYGALAIQVLREMAAAS